MFLKCFDWLIKYKLTIPRQMSVSWSVCSLSAAPWLRPVPCRPDARRPVVLSAALCTDCAPSELSSGQHVWSGTANNSHNNCVTALGYVQFTVTRVQVRLSMYELIVNLMQASPVRVEHSQSLVVQPTMCIVWMQSSAYLLAICSQSKRMFCKSISQFRLQFYVYIVASVSARHSKKLPFWEADIQGYV